MVQSLNQVVYGGNVQADIRMINGNFDKRLPRYGRIFEHFYGVSFKAFNALALTLLPEHIDLFERIVNRRASNGLEEWWLEEADHLIKIVQQDGVNKHTAESMVELLKRQ